MKINRAQLKSLIKECLIEILAEGIGQSGKKHLDEATQAVQEANRNLTARRRVLEQQRIVQARSNATAAAGMLKNQIKSLTNGDTVLSSILANTAQTTLREQSSAPDPERNGSLFASMFNPGPSAPMPIEESYSAAPDIPAAQVSGWERAAFGRSSNSQMSMMLGGLPPPPEPRRLSKEELDRKVG